MMQAKHVVITRSVKFADPQPETFWVFDLLDARDLVSTHYAALHHCS